MSEFELLGTLLAFAQISVAFLGFSGVVSVFIPKENTLWVRGTMFRMRIMLETSTFALLFSLLPISFIAMGMPEPLMWRVDAAMLLILFLWFSAIYFRRSREQLKIEKSTVSPVLLVFYYATVPFILLALALSLADIWINNIPGLHIAIITYWLGSSAIFFFRMVLFAYTQANEASEQQGNSS